MNAKKLALLSVLTALSVITFMLENLFPPIFVPGAKLGLGNVFVLIALIYLGFGSALIMVVAKCLITAIFVGFSALAYSLPSGLISVTLSFLLLRCANNVSIVATASASATVHNLVQNAVFALITQTPKVLLYAPYLALLGAICGTLTGLATCLTVNTTSSYLSKKAELKKSQED